MFNIKENRYITRGVNKQIPQAIQLRCWQMIDEKVKKSEVTMDYLQIFEFNRDDQRKTISIIHRQEEPFFIDHHECQMINDLTNFKVKKLWVIDDQTHQTMLLPEEY